MDKTTLKPKIRFKKFTDDWEQCKVCELVEFLRGRGLSWNDIKEDGNNECILYGNLYTDYGMVIKEVNYKTNVSKDNMVLSKFGDVLIPSSDTTPTGLARASSIDIADVILGGDINVLRPIKDNGDFISYSINANKSELVKRVKGTTVRHLNNSDIEDLELKIPSSIEEQEKISSALINIDNLIILHQSKYDKLVKAKKSLLEKMFPKNNSKIPEIRFKEFTDDWEQRKLDKVAKYRNGKAHENDISDNGKYIVVNSKFVSTNGNVRKFSEKQNEALYKDEIAFVLSDVPNGRALARTFLVDESDKYTLNQRIAGITPFEEINSYFLYVLMNRNKYFLQFDDGAKQTNLSVEDVVKFEEYYPYLTEQTKIGNMFKKIDNLITLRQRNLEKLKEVKKTLLKKMFI